MARQDAKVRASQRGIFWVGLFGLDGVTGWNVYLRCDCPVGLCSERSCELLDMTYGWAREPLAANELGFH